jgi:hypothetical protein
VPFESDTRHDVIKVACAAPVPRRSLAALRELTGSIIEPYLVSDEQWPALLQAYTVAARRAGAAQTTLPDIDTLVGRVAEAARASGGVRMSEARCDDNLWVRLDVSGHIEEFWLSVAGPVRESAVAEAPTRARAKRPRTAGQAPRERRRRPVASDLAPEPAPATTAAARDLAFVEKWTKAPAVPMVQR